jgi:S1-C subfamily serine protease
MYLFFCVSVILISGCAATTSAVNFPDNRIYGDYGIEYNEQNAVPIKSTYILEEDDEPAPAKTGINSLLSYNFVDKVAGFAFSSATGNVISHDGYILTNHHVVDKNPFKIQVMVGVGNKTAATATIVADDPVNDLAVIKINHTFANIVHFGSADDIRINQTIYYWGYPFGLSRESAGKCFHRGFISQLNAHNAFFSPLTRFYMGIRGAHGVSGSAIYGTDGRAIGIMQGFVADGQHFVAIPVDQVTDFLTAKNMPFSR